MAWTSPTFTYTVGQVLTANNLNTYLSANTQSLATPPMWRVYRAGAWNTVATTLSVVPYGAGGVSFDSASGYSSSTSMYTVRVAGTYFCTATLNSSVTTAGHGAKLLLYLTGSAYTQGLWGVTQGPEGWSASVSDLVGPCVVGDTIAGEYVALFVDAMVIGSATNFFSGVKVSN